MSISLRIIACSAVLGASVHAQPLARKAPPYMPPPKGEPSFFVTSAGSGKGGDLGGLAGADRQCRMLATAAGLPARDWRAYLSTQATATEPAVNARDRIGKGPWFNVQGLRVAAGLAELHGDTLELARAGNTLSKSLALSEKREIVPGEGDAANAHDILTGTRADGTAYDGAYDRTCSNWTSSSPDGSAQIGHSDRDSHGISISWNSAHQTLGCSIPKLASTGGGGRFYCFAADPR